MVRPALDAAHPHPMTVSATYVASPDAGTGRARGRAAPVGPAGGVLAAAAVAGGLGARGRHARLDDAWTAGAAPHWSSEQAGPPPMAALGGLPADAAAGPGRAGRRAAVARRPAPGPGDRRVGDRLAGRPRSSCRGGCAGGTAGTPTSPTCWCSPTCCRRSPSTWGWPAGCRPSSSTVHLRGLPAPGWVRAVQSATLLQDGWLDEDCLLWDSEDRLVAQARQLAGLPAAAEAPSGWPPVRIRSGATWSRAAPAPRRRQVPVTVRGPVGRGRRPRLQRELPRHDRSVRGVTLAPYAVTVLREGVARRRGAGAAAGRRCCPGRRLRPAARGAAVQRVQARADLRPTGVVRRATWRALGADREPRRGRAASRSRSGRPDRPRSGGLVAALAPRVGAAASRGTSVGLTCSSTTSRVITHVATSPRDGMSYITDSRTSSMIARRPRAPVPRRIAWSAIALERVVGELELDAVELEQPAVLPDQRVLRLGEDRDERVAVEVVHAGDHRQAADELRDHAVLEQVLRHDVAEDVAAVDLVLAVQDRAEADAASCRCAPR